MSLFDGILFPDNESRKKRAVQLYQDCESLVEKLARQKLELETALAEVKNAFTSALSGSDQELMNQVHYTPSSDWTVEVPVAISPLISLAGKSLSGIAAAASATVLGNSLLLISMFGLPDGFPKNTSSGLINYKEIFGIVPAVVDGAVVRSQLRDLIKKLIASRLQLNQAYMTNQILITALTGMASNVKMTVSSIMGVSKDVAQQKTIILAFVETYVQLYQKEIVAVSTNEAQAALNVLDRNRGAWQNEDNYS